MSAIVEVVSTVADTRRTDEMVSFVNCQTVPVHRTIQIIYTICYTNCCSVGDGHWNTYVCLCIIGIRVADQTVLMDDLEDLGSVEQEQERSQNGPLGNAVLQP